MFSNVIVGGDEQQGSRDAIALARDLMAEGGELALAHVHHGETMPIGSSNRGIAAGLEAGRICIRSPSVGQGLHELAERQRADLLVMGSCRTRPDRTGLRQRRHP